MTFENYKYKHMKRLLIILSTAVAFQSIYAQKAQFKKQLKKSIKEIRADKGKKSVSAYLFKKYITEIPEAILKELPKYEMDTLNNVRQLVYDLNYQIARRNEKTNIRQAAVLNLVKACEDKEPDIRRSIGNKLKYFKKEDFSQEAKNILTSYLKKGENIWKNSVRLVGFLDMDNQIPFLHALLNDTSISDERSRREVRLTLARLGDKEQIAYCINLAKSKGVNDRIIHFLLKDLVYIRQKEAFEYLLDILYSDEKNCRPPNPELYDPIVCGYRIMELLAPAIEDFPFETYPGTSQLKADDYDKTLVDVRQWFEEHSNYKIKRDTF